MIASGIKAKVQSYIDDVLSGEIVVCKMVRQAVERHVRDLERQRTADFPYYFNERHAGVACDFFPMMLRHSTGKFKGLPFELEPWQAFGVWVLFGWKRCADDSRRFRRFFWSMGRKNGKSCIAAGMAILCAMFDINPITKKPESVAEVILCAPKKAQVEEVIYAEIIRMREASPFIEKASTAINRQIRFTGNGGVIKCTGSDRPFSGLNPSLVLMDETHEWKPHNRRFYDTMLTGSISRSQPLIGSITTAGDELSEIWKNEHDLAKTTLDEYGSYDSFFCLVFELDEDDDPLDEDLWVKGNPNIGVSLDFDSLREQPKKSAIDLNRFTRFHCNRIVTSTERAFDLTQWDACEGDLSDWHDADAVGAGVDLGGLDDFAAWGMVARFEIDPEPGEDNPEGKPVYRYEVRSQAYIATNAERDLTQPPFINWVNAGLLRRCKHPTKDLRDDLIEQVAEYGVHAVGYDNYNAQQLGGDLEEEGITAARVPQNYLMFNEPIRDFLQAIKDGRVKHDGGPLLRWCAGNAIVVQDRHERWMFDKRSSSEKIDPIVAVVMAFRMASLAPPRVRGNLYMS